MGIAVAFLFIAGNLYMPGIPRDKAFDATFALRRDPYGFIAKRCERLHSDVFETRIMLRRTICMTGHDAARVFYDSERFTRRGAAPLRVQETLMGVGGVQSLEGATHRRRKELLLSLVSPARIEELRRIADAQWTTFANRWTKQDNVVLYDEMRHLLLLAACEWAGVPLAEDAVATRARDITSLFEHAPTLGPLRSRLGARERMEAWIMECVLALRADRMTASRGGALFEIAWYRDFRGVLLAPRVAAVEILNVLRPIVAVSVYIALAATALARYPEWRARISGGSDESLEAFAQEVRRFYPFFPTVVARVRQDFEWNGYRFRRGRRAILDLHGTNRDARIFDDPSAFRPERFLRATPGPFELIPQGGGDPVLDHRCAGEPITVELMKDALRYLVLRIDYDVPPQNLAVDETKVPAVPRSRFIMHSVTMREAGTPTSPVVPQAVKADLSPVVHKRRAR